MVRVAATPDLAEARRLSRIREERAVEVHNRFLAAQRAARGAAFGTSESEVEWKDLKENYRDDNRAVTDQMELPAVSPDFPVWLATFTVFVSVQVIRRS